MHVEHGGEGVEKGYRVRVGYRGRRGVKVKGNESRETLMKLNEIFPLFSRFN